MDGVEAEKRNSLWKGGIAAQSHLLITLRKGILTASQTDLMRTAIAERIRKN